MTHTTTVRLKQLVPGDTINSRTTGRDEGLSELAASIEAHGLILPLAVRRSGENFQVIDGNRRVAALALLQKEGKLAEDAAIPVLIREDDDAGAHEASLAANIMRERLHPADQFEAFAKLRADGRTVEKIAQSFGTSVKTVKQRLALGTVIPEVMAAFRNEEINLETVQAFTAVNAERQKTVWDELGKSRHKPGAWAVRDALRKNVVSSKSALAKFVGAKAYEKAGGTIGHDLFQSENLWEDSALVMRLAREKVQGEIDRLLADGWSWAALAEDLGEKWQWSWTRLTAETCYATPEDEARARAIETRQGEIDDADHSEEENDNLMDEYRTLENEADEIRERATEEFTSDQKKLSGVVIRFDRGEDPYTYGVVKPGDAKAAAKAEGGARGDTDDEIEDDKPNMGNSVVRDLEGVLTDATQIAIASNSALAEAVLIVTLARSATRSGGARCLSLSTQDAFRQYEGVFAKQLSAVLAGAVATSPFSEAVEYATALPAKTRAKLLAHLVAASLKKTASVKEIVKLASPKPEKIWYADEAFLKRLSKTQIMEALKEAGCAEAAQKGQSAKKGELLLLAAKALADTKWLPTPLRTPAYVGPGDIPQTEPMDNPDDIESDEKDHEEAA